MIIIRFDTSAMNLGYVIILLLSFVCVILSPMKHHVARCDSRAGVSHITLILDIVESRRDDEVDLELRLVRSKV